MESSQEKNEKPTPKKITDARKEGNVAYSRDLSMFITLIVIVAELLGLYHYITNILMECYVAIFNTINNHQLLTTDLVDTTLMLMVNSGKLILLLIVMAALATGLTTVIQMGGFLIKEKPFKFDLQKFNPVANLKQIFGKKSWLKFAFNCIKVLIMICVNYFLLIRVLRDVFLMTNLTLPALCYFIFITIMKIVIVSLGIYMLFSLIDFILERQQWYKDLMMSREEIKKENKETNGNPEIKNQRKELQRELLEDDEMAEYKGSMMVLANPTHIAIGILYMPLKWQLPVIVIKAKNGAAQNVFRKAKQNGIPVIRDKWLARQLYQVGELSKFVPPSLTKDVAQIIGSNLHLLPKVAAEIEEIKQGLNKPGNIAEVSKQFERLRVSS